MIFINFYTINKKSELSNVLPFKFSCVGPWPMRPFPTDDFFYTPLTDILIKSICKNCYRLVRIKGEMIEVFKMDKGLKQGDSLSPLLIIIYHMVNGRYGSIIYHISYIIIIYWLWMILLSTVKENCKNTCWILEPENCHNSTFALCGYCSLS